MDHRDGLQPLDRRHLLAAARPDSGDRVQCEEPADLGDRVGLGRALRWRRATQRQASTSPSKVSAYATHALQRQLERDGLDDLIGDLVEINGPLDADAVARYIDEWR